MNIAYVYHTALEFRTVLTTLPPSQESYSCNSYFSSSNFLFMPRIGFEYLYVFVFVRVLRRRGELL